MEFLTAKVPESDCKTDQLIAYLQQQKREINFILELVYRTQKGAGNIDLSGLESSIKSTKTAVEALQNKDPHTTLQTINGWTVIKHSSGWAECYRKLTCSNVQCSTAWGSLYESASYGNLNYPITFKEIPSQSLCISGTGAGAYMLQYPYTYGSDNCNQTKTNTGKWCFVRPRTQSTTDTVYVDIIVKGRWK